MEKFLFNSNENEVDVYIKNIGAKKTLLFIHGFNSSHHFADNLYKMDNNFNIITLDLPAKIADFNIFVEIIIDLIERVIKGKIILLGHSLGGALTLNLNHWKIKDRILVAPLNPSITQTKKYLLLSSIMKPETSIQKFRARAIKKTISTVANIQNNNFIRTFLDEKSPFNNIVMNQILSEEFMKKLDYLYKKHDALYLIGTSDEIISSKLFDSYLKSLNKEVILISDASHNPFKTHAKIIYDILNEKILYKKRFFIKKFYREKYLKKV